MESIFFNIIIHFELFYFQIGFVSKPNIFIIILYAYIHGIEYRVKHLYTMISYLLSITTIILSVIMKAPQIIRIYNQKQTGGINLTSLLLDLIK